MLRKIKFFTLCLLVNFMGLNATYASAFPFSSVKVPDSLKSWIPWVLDGEQDPACPLSKLQDQTQCAWPGVLELKLVQSGGVFQQDWRLYAEAWVQLPGSIRDWPQEVLVDGKAAPVIARHGTPSLFLSKGLHRVSGGFWWKQIPESLPLGQGTALLNLQLHGAQLSHPVRDESNVLWLQKKLDAKTEEEAELKVYRRLQDGIPVELETRFHLDVSGRPREIRIGRGLLPQLIPIELKSQLTAVLDKSGSVVVQARPGSWDITLKARLPSELGTLTLPPASDLSAEEEIWVFEDNQALRLVQLEGGQAIDTSQTSLPAEWRRLPAYYMRDSGASLHIKELLRGDSDPGPDRLHLNRQMWLSFDGGEWNISDHLTGSLNRPRRLSFMPQVQAGRISLGQQDQQISLTRDGLAGVEVSGGSLNLQAEHKLMGMKHHFPANLWQLDLESLAIQLQLPPGWRLLHAQGAEHASDTWISTWSLSELGFILGIAALAWYVCGAPCAAVSLSFLVLSHQEMGVPRFVWLSCLSLLAIYRLAKGHRFAIYCAYSARATGLFLLVFFVAFGSTQFRNAIYTSLDTAGTAGYSLASQSASADVRLSRVQLPGNPPAEPVEAPPEAPREMAVMVNAAPAYIPPPELSMVEASPVPASPSETERVVPLKLGIDPNARVQTGVGMPLWHWHQYDLSFDGPMKPDQELSLWLLSPRLNLCLSFIRVALLVLLLLWILRDILARDVGGNDNGGRGSVGIGNGRDDRAEKSSLWGKLGTWLKVAPSSNHILQKISVFSKALLASILLSVMWCSIPAYAVEMQGWEPSKETLQELKDKVLRRHPCSPNCAEISRLVVHLHRDQARLQLDLDALVDTPVALPSNIKSWLPHSARLDGQAAFIQRENGGQLFFLVPAGRHRLELIGDLIQSDSLLLPLAQAPRHLEIDAPEWDFAGISEDHKIADVLQFSRRQKTTRGNLANSVNEFPALLRIERHFSFAKEWSVETSVQRLSPLGSAILAQIPLAAGESVISPDIVVKDQKVQLNLGPQNQRLSWVSSLKQSDDLLLKASTQCAEAQIAECIEQWTLSSDNTWHLEPRGIPPTMSEDNHHLHFVPWPGEELQLKVERPQAQQGQTSTIDYSRLEIKLGKRVTDYELSMAIRSSRGTEHRIRLPDGAVLDSVHQDGVKLSGRLVDHHVILNLHPGRQEFSIHWRMEQDLPVSLSTAQLDLGLASVNHSIKLTTMPDQWLLTLSDGPLAPIILFWPKLIALLILALCLMRVRLLPVKPWHWILLCVGLSPLPWWQILAVVMWFYLVAYRSKNVRMAFVLRDVDSQPDIAWQHNAFQILLMLVSAIGVWALITLLNTIVTGQVDMLITGNGSDSSQLQWYFDRIGAITPSVNVVSVPMIVYRALMSAWVIVIAWPLKAWTVWGWQAFTQGCIWIRPASFIRESEQSESKRAPEPIKSRSTDQ